MTYNIQGHAAARNRGHLAGISDVIRSASPDVVCLQEVHCRTRKAGLDQAGELGRLTGLGPAFGRSCAMDGGDYGNAVLTGGEVRASEVFALPGGGEPRSVMRTDIVVRGKPVSVFVTHLSAWGRLRRRERLEQIARLGEITADAAPPHLLAGDFNVPPSSLEIRTLTSRGKLFPADDLRAVTYRLTRQRLDYVFCDPRWTVLRSEVLRRGPSDHWPIVVELGLEVA